MESKASVNEELAQELHKLVIKNLRRRKVYGRFKDYICAADLVQIGSLSSKIWGAKYSLCVVDVFTKYAWSKPLKADKAKTVFPGLIEIVDESNCKPNKLWVDQGKKLCNDSMQNWLDDNNILIYSTPNEGKSVVA